MKNIYKIKLILLALVVFSSCAVNDDDPVQNLVIESKVSLNVEIDRVATTTQLHGVTVNLSTPLPYSSRLIYTLDGEEMFIDIDARSETATIPVDMSSNTTRLVTLTDIVSLYASAEDYDVSLSSDTTTRIVKMEEGDVYVQMTWSTTDDIDLVLNAAPAPTAPYIPSPSNVVNYSINTTPLESFIISRNEAPGAYAVSIIPYEAFSSTINFDFLIVDSVAEYNFQGAAENGLAATGGFFSPLTYNTVIEAVSIVKTGFGSSSTYVIENKL